MPNSTKGLFTTLEGQSVYKIENYDQMDNFFMTITSSSDIWNFCWSQGGLTAGRINSNHSIFPYYTADKVSDAASYTGNYTCVRIKKGNEVFYWEPFAQFHSSAALRSVLQKSRINNLYKNTNGTQIWFEEINIDLKVLFRTSWTSSQEYGVVRSSHIENLSDEKLEITVLDGCQNILPACCTSDFQNEKSILLDAYKKTDLDTVSNLALFTVSSIVSDKAEPNEGLYANTCWFSTDDTLIIDTQAPAKFVKGEEITFPTLSKGQRSSCFICRTITEKTDDWYQVFNTSQTMIHVLKLKEELKSKKTLISALAKDIEEGNALMTELISQADGIQTTADKMTCLHHQQNVMFNIMRGGLFANNGEIGTEDFIIFISQRNKKLVPVVEELLKDNRNKLLNYETLWAIMDKAPAADKAQINRLFLEYMPLTFSRRHGDPSRPWNQFNIVLKDSNSKPILNYEGNWRDIFQNWEALAWSYPMYIKNMCAKFLNAMTIEGFNPYRISRDGVDWEIPDPTNPWAQIGYWGDHQVIYFEKLLEFYDKTNHDSLLASLDEKIYTSSNVPYRLKSYDEIVKNPRSTILFDKELSDALKANAKKEGSDAKLIQDKNNKPYLVSFSAKVLQIVISKIANLIPGGGIWLNTQRPEWNDANNALAGYGLSVVTLCYLYRFTNFLTKLYEQVPEAKITLPEAIKNCLFQLCDLYKQSGVEECASNPATRKTFTDKAEKIFEAERNELYTKGYNGRDEIVTAKEIANILKTFNTHIEYTIKINKRADKLYHSYNTVKITDKEMIVENLQEMLEGQVAVLSSGELSPAEAEEVVEALINSKMYEPAQHSFMLYPDKVLPEFFNKNLIPAEYNGAMAKLAERTGTRYVEKDLNGSYHFNPDFRNSNVLNDFVAAQEDKNKPTDSELTIILEAYEKTFNHQSFTGRSGTFYAYEGLGSIYWHMVSKLLLAVQENLFIAQEKGDTELTQKLTKSYYKVRAGLGYNKTPEVYGAFPADPYSHTPRNQGAKQPGMTGQVKEEILTRWGELGLSIRNGTVSFEPTILPAAEIDEDGKLQFTWCGVAITYNFTNASEASIIINDKDTIKGTEIPKDICQKIYCRNGEIKSIKVNFNSKVKGINL